MFIFNPSEMDVLLESITRQQYKELQKHTKDYNRDRYDNIFGSKRQNRIYLLEDNPIKSDINLYNFVWQNFGDEFSFIGGNLIYNYNKIPNIKTNLDHTSFTPFDFIEGTIPMDDGRKLKISKACDTVLKNIDLLNEMSHFTDKNDFIDSINDVKKSLTKKPTKAELSGLELIICISRSPYDVLSMSTNQRWSSCQNLNDAFNNGKFDEDYWYDEDSGNFKNDWGDIVFWAHALEDVKEGTLIAYLIDKRDKNMRNIKPYARLLIKPKTDKIYSSTEGAKWILEPEDHCYKDSTLKGTTYDKFEETIDNWCKSINKYEENVIYQLPKSLYDDSDGSKAVTYKTNITERAIKERIEKAVANKLGHKWVDIPIMNSYNFIDSINILDNMDLDDTIHVSLCLMNGMGIMKKDLPKHLNYMITSYVPSKNSFYPENESDPFEAFENHENIYTLTIYGCTNGKPLFDTISKNGGLELLKLQISYNPDNREYEDEYPDNPEDNPILNYALAYVNDGNIDWLTIELDSGGQTQFLDYGYLIEENNGYIHDINVFSEYHNTNEWLVDGVVSDNKDRSNPHRGRSMNIEFY